MGTKIMLKIDLPYLATDIPNDTASVAKPVISPKNSVPSIDSFGAFISPSKSVIGSYRQTW